MFGSRGEFLMSKAEMPKKPNALWRSLKLVSSALIIFSIPAAFAPLPVEDFMRLLSLWNSGSGWMTAHCLYVVLNIVILALTVGDKSGGHEFKTQNHSTISLSDSKSHPNSTEIIDCVSVPRSLCKKSASTAKLSTLSQEGSEITELKQLSDQISVQEAAPLASTELVVFEICADDGEGESENEEMGFNCEEVDAKAESFIQNFHRQLKMQREDSWKSLSAIYKRSC